MSAFLEEFHTTHGFKVGFTAYMNHGFNQTLVQRLNDVNLRSSIVRNQEWDSVLAQLHSLDLSKLVFCLLGLDSVDGETTFGIVDETEMLLGLLDGDDIHEASWVGGIGADLAINLDQALHDNSLGLASIESIL